MSTKLTLTIDKKIIERAEKHAKNQGRSLSNLIEEYLKSVIVSDEDIDDLELSPSIKSLLGSVKIKEDINSNYKEILADEKVKKYLK